ncbi:hypothetical protein BLA29_015225, partial [Euroglyphus maynei]
MPRHHRTLRIVAVSLTRRHLRQQLLLHRPPESRIAGQFFRTPRHVYRVDKQIKCRRQPSVERLGV